MEKGIKVGDRVRVSEDAPRIYTDGWRFDWRNSDSLVGIVEEDDAVISPDDSGEESLVIPCKYLVKVDTDAKEPSRIFYGDYAKVASQSLEELKIKAHPEWFPITEHTEHTEHTEAEEDARIRQKEAELDEFRKAELDRIMHPEKPTFEVTIDNVAMDWQRYEADLAKEVALKVANKYTDPKEAAEYAVSVAQAVVEGLKRK